MVRLFQDILDAACDIMYVLALIDTSFFLSMDSVSYRRCGRGACSGHYEDCEVCECVAEFDESNEAFYEEYD